MSESLDPSLVESYDYELPKELIASEPADPPQNARLLVYDRKSGKTEHSFVKNLPDLIGKECAILFNDTKVIKARLFGKKSSGGKIELLLDRPLSKGRYEVFIRGRVKKGSRLIFEDSVTAIVEELGQNGMRVVSFYQKGSPMDFEALIEFMNERGIVPLPPYIKRSASKKDEKLYQNPFAQKYGAVAAPTASLHFGEELKKEITERFDTFFVTLHVGAGTFLPLKTDRIEGHSMHKEFFEIPKRTQKLIDSDREILAVGTTVTRAVEYYARTKIPSGECDLFLNPMNPPIRVNHLLTNFHLPKSTLIMLVASFIGLKKTMELYELAVRRRYRFYSYGDAMLIL